MSVAVRPAWQGDLAFLATLLRARLRDETGADASTFSSTSSPSVADAQGAMDAVCDEMGVGLPDEVPERFWSALQRCASYGAAAILEAGNYPEQTRTDQSPRPTWQAKHDQCAPNLIGLVLADVADGAPGDGLSGGQRPLGCFPAGDLVSGRPW